MTAAGAGGWRDVRPLGDTHPVQRVKVRLRDWNDDLVAAWTTHFAGLDDVEVSAGDIFDLTADAIVSPANCFGFMDGGIDAAYCERFGWDLQDRLQAHLSAEHDGELPIGQAVVIDTDDVAVRYLVSAPTMRLPGPVPQTLNAYLAFRAALQAVRRHNAVHPGSIASLLCPGMATAVGQMPPDRCARQMRAAYDNVELGRSWGRDSGGVSGILRQHILLLR